MNPSAHGASEPLWVRIGFLVAAVVAICGDVLFVRSGGSNSAWTAYLGAYLGAAAIVAVVGGAGRAGMLRTACRAGATGAAGTFVLLGALSIGVLFVPLAAWLAIATLGGGRAQQAPKVAMIAAMLVAVVVPLVGVLTVFHR